MTWWIWYILVGLIVGGVTAYVEGRHDDVSVEDAAFSILMAVVFWPLAILVLLFWFIYQLGKLDKRGKRS